jgi:hypothetical protein
MRTTGQDDLGGLLNTLQKTRQTLSCPPFSLEFGMSHSLSPSFWPRLLNQYQEP